MHVKQAKPLACNVDHKTPYNKIIRLDCSSKHQRSCSSYRDLLRTSSDGDYDTILRLIQSSRAPSEIGVGTARDAGARQEVDLPGLSGRFRACAVSLRMVPVLLNLVRKLPVPTDCRYCALGIFIISICFR
jgi:hypothetical protein